MTASLSLAAPALGALGTSTDDVQLPLVPWGLLIIALGIYAVAVAAVLAAGRREDARALAGFIPDCAILLGRLARDSRVSRLRRAVLFAVIAYLSLPIDLVPDFLPVAGQLDDAVLVALALRTVARGASASVIRQAWPGPEASLTIVLRAAGMHRNGADGLYA